MHPIYTTPGFIIDSRSYGEAGKLFYIFTRDFGLITATAQGIRLEKSKLRYHAREYSFGTFSLVRGREFWRLTSAKEFSARAPLGDSSALARSSSASWRTPPRATLLSPAGHGQELLARIALLLRRLLGGEEANPGLFDCVQSCDDFLRTNVLSDEQVKNLESLVVLRMLERLGYVGGDEALKDYLSSTEVTTGLIDSVAGKRAIINRHINKALKESHL